MLAKKNRGASMGKRGWALLLAMILTVSTVLPVAAAEGGMENFKPVAQYTNGQFTDVPAGVWYEAALGKCVNYALMNGATDTTFAPKGDLTLAQALVMAVRVHQIYAKGESTLEKSEPWYQSALTYAVEVGLVGEDELTELDAPATRGQMAGLFARALPAKELREINTVTALPDVNDQTAYTAEILTLYRAGVVAGGDSAGSYHPAAAVSRGEAAAIVARLVFPALRRPLELFTPADLTLANEGISAVDGSALGKQGERMETYFFDFMAQSAYTCVSFEGYQPAKGNKLLVVRLVLKNTSPDVTAMYDVDFQICWDNAAEDAYAFPLTREGLVSSQLPGTYDLAVNAARGGVLVFEIPAATQGCTLVYEEYFSGGKTGNSFFVALEPPEKENRQAAA